MASEVAKTLRDRRQQAWHEARTLLDVSTEEKRELTEIEGRKFEALNGEIDKIDERLKAVLDAEQRSRETDEAYNRLASRPQEVRATFNQFEDEMRNWMRGTSNDLSPRVIRREQSTRSLNHILRGGMADPRVREELRIMTTNGVLAGSTNASASVPVDFYDQLISYLIEVSGLLQTGPSVLNTAGGETIQVPVASAHITGTSVAQGATIPSADPALSQKTLSSQKFGALTQLSRELIDDTAVDLLGYLAMSTGRAIGNAFGSALVNGTSSISGGVLAGAAASVTGVTATGTLGAPIYDNLVDLEYSVIAPYRQSRSCYWLAADKTIGAMRKIKDGNGRPIWEPSAVLGAPDLLLGKPLVSDPFMPQLGATGRQVLAFGDFSQYFVRLVGGLRFERSDDFAFGSDLITFRALLRGDGNWGDATAVKTFVTNAAT
jgi:HK97 family phage major capsid protein